jgi:hypothetical protein
MLLPPVIVVARFMGIIRRFSQSSPRVVPFLAEQAVAGRRNLANLAFCGASECELVHILA